MHIRTKNVELELGRWGVVVFLGVNLGKMRLETFKGVGERRTWDWYEPVSAAEPQGEQEWDRDWDVNGERRPLEEW